MKTPQIAAVTGMTPLGMRTAQTAKAANPATKVAKPAAAKAAKPAPAPTAKAPWREPMPADLQAIADAAKRDPKPAAKADPKAPKPPGQRAQVEADAAAGKLPSPPDFSANTHKPYRARLKVLVELAKAGDLKGLREVAMLAPRSSSPKALLKYRDLAVTALEARAAKQAAG